MSQQENRTNKSNAILILRMNNLDHFLRDVSTGRSFVILPRKDPDASTSNAK